MREYASRSDLPATFISLTVLLGMVSHLYTHRLSVLFTPPYRHALRRDPVGRTAVGRSPWLWLLAIPATLGFAMFIWSAT